MKSVNHFQRLRRNIEFARHMPVAKLVRRVELDVRRRLGLHHRVPAAPSPPLCPAAPQPIFPPRTGSLAFSGDTATFCFLNHAASMPRERVDWAMAGPDGRDQLWRMNLHYMEYLEGVDDEAFTRLVEDWIEANPANGPGAWRDSWNSYALSLRVVVWMQQIAVREALPPDTLERMRDNLAVQLRYLTVNLETDLGGNHLIKNIKALIWASAFFAGAEAGRWRDLGLALLWREIEIQVPPDGMHYERSASYHAQVFADLLECRYALGRDPLGGLLDAALIRMAQVTADLSHPDGDPALFNDAGLHMAYSPAECLAAFEAVLGRSPPEARAVFALPDAGYYGQRTGSGVLIADCGRIAPDDLPAHGHGDVLSFEWSVSGRRIVVDQGVFEYLAGPRRTMSRAAASHNTLSLQGADQADFFGAFRCGRRPAVTVRSYQTLTTGFVLEGSHDGFRHLPGRPSHVRRFEVTPRAVRIVDRIEGRCGEPAAIGFLLHPGCKAEHTPAGACIIMTGTTRIVLTCSATVEIEPAVWWPDMGVEQSTVRLRTRLVQGQSEIVSQFVVETE